MNIGSLCAGQLRKILALLKKKESLEADLARVADAIDRFQTGEDVALEAGTKGQVKVVPVGTGKPKYKIRPRVYALKAMRQSCS